MTPRFLPRSRPALRWKKFATPPAARRRTLASSAAADPRARSVGFSGAGFLGCYHVGAAACLRRHGWLTADPLDRSTHETSSSSLPHPQPPDRDAHGPLLTGVSAGSMVAAAIAAGVVPDPDGMDVVLAAARKTRQFLKKDGGVVPLDVLTPGFSLIDAVEGPFREALAKALGGAVVVRTGGDDDGGEEGGGGAGSFDVDIDPELFRRRFPPGRLRVGLADRRALWPYPVADPDRLANAYRYVESFRNVEDVVAACMLSSYVPGVTGHLNLGDVVSLPGYAGGPEAHSAAARNSAADRAGRRLREMRLCGLVTHGSSGFPVEDPGGGGGRNAGDRDGEEVDASETEAQEASNGIIDYWDGGIVDVFPTFDERTVIVSPLNGDFGSQPAIRPEMPASSDGNEIENENENDGASPPWTDPAGILRRALLLPRTIRHCRKLDAGLNAANAQTLARMIFSSDDDELCRRFRDGYDDARRFLDKNGQLRVFTG